MSDILKEMYELLAKKECKTLKQASEQCGYELGTIIPIGYGINMSIEPSAIMTKTAGSWEKAKILEVLFKRCGSLHVNFEIAGFDTIGGVLYANVNLGSALIVRSDKNKQVFKYLNNSELSKYGVNILWWDEANDFFDKYYYVGKLTKF